MEIDEIRVISYTILVLFAISFIYFNMSLDELKERISNITTKLPELDNRISNLEKNISMLSSMISEINESINNLNSNISSLNNNLSAIKMNLSLLREEIDLLKERLRDLENLSNNILSTENYIKNWFESSIKEASPMIDNLIRNANQCIRGYAFDLGCFSYYLYHVYRLRYADDNETYGREDVFVKPTTLLRYKKGDCEDFTFLYFIVLNKIKYRGYYLKFPVYSPGSKYYLYETSLHIYYLDNYKSITEDLRYYDVYFVCFNKRKPQNLIGIGHCVVALCRDLRSVKDITSDKCLLLETLNYGSLYIKDNSSNTYSPNGIDWYIIENIAYLMNRTHFCYFYEVSKCIEI